MTFPNPLKNLITLLKKKFPKFVSNFQLRENGRRTIKKNILKIEVSDFLFQN